MASALIDQATGLSSSVAIKAPCRVASISNLTLSGLQTVDGVALNPGDRVLVRSQTVARYNGIYNASTGPWVRAADFDSNDDVVKGSRTNVTSGASASGDWQVGSENPIAINLTDIVFSTYSNAGLSLAVAQAQDYATQSQGWAVASQSSADDSEASAVRAENAAGGNLSYPDQTIAADATTTIADIDLVTTVLTTGPTMKKIAWSAFKAVLKSYFDGAYVGLGSYTALDVKNKLLTVDGAGSGIDADLLDGQDGTHYQVALGFTPVQQGGGVGQLTNPVKIGWSGTALKATVDAVDQGTIYTSNNPPAVGQPVPSSSTFAVGDAEIMLFSNGAVNTVANGATCAGTLVATFASQGNGSGLAFATVPGATQSGTWRNISGHSLSGSGTLSAGRFVRVS